MKKFHLLTVFAFCAATLLAQTGKADQLYLLTKVQSQTS